MFKKSLAGNRGKRLVTCLGIKMKQKTMRTSIHSKFASIQKLILLVIGCLCSATAFSQDHEHGVNIGFFYPLSVQGIHSTEYSNVFSLQALMGISKAEKGFTASGFANIIRENASGFQIAGFMNTIGGSSEGFKAAGFLNLYHHANGFQAAGFANFAKGNVMGMQGAGFMNLADRVTGFQAAGYFNKADDVKGTQAAGFMNMAENVDGTQIAGFINMAKKVKGAQIAGFINIADSSEYPIGIINIIGNGERFLGVTTDDNFSTLVTFRSGSKKLYGIIGLGYNFKNNKESLAYTYGIGAHVVNYKNFRLKTEGTVTQLEDFKKGDFTKTSLTVLPSIKLGNRVELFAGPSLNYVNSTTKDGNELVDHYMWRRFSKSNNREYGMYVGYTAGVQIKM
jgi:hypothetical protein